MCVLLWIWWFLVDVLHDILDIVSQRIFQCNKSDEVVLTSEFFNSFLSLEIIFKLKLLEGEIFVRESDCSVSIFCHITLQYSFHVVFIRHQSFVNLIWIIYPVFFEIFHWEDFLVFIVLHTWFEYKLWSSFLIDTNNRLAFQIHVFNCNHRKLSLRVKSNMGSDSALSPGHELLSIYISFL